MTKAAVPCAVAWKIPVNKAVAPEINRDRNVTCRI